MATYYIFITEDFLREHTLGKAGMLIVMNALIRFAATLAVIGLLVTGTFWALDRTLAEDTTDETPVYSLNEAALSSGVQSLLDENSNLQISVSITDLQTNKTYHYGDASNYAAASINKLITATLYLHDVEMGRVTMNDLIGAETASTQLEKMIVKSDNDAWHSFNAKLSLAVLQQYAQKIGLSSYDANDNTINTDDVALLLDKLSRGKLLNNDNTGLLLSLLGRANYRNYIVAGIPAGATTYHKVGYLSDRLHDAAIIKKGDRAYVLVIFSKSSGNYDFSQGTTLMQNITRTTSTLILTDTVATSD